MPVLSLNDISADDIDIVGGKGASLGELTAAGLPVPPGFVVTAGTYRTFIEEAGIDEELFEAVDIDPEDSSALRAAADRAHELITGTELTTGVRQEILSSYRDMGSHEEPFVAVRSSATAEDLPDASFAGQQETFLNVREQQLLDRVRECWASLFTQRAIYYRQRQGFPHDAVDIAVVVQQMVDADKSGVMFTSHPSTGDPQMVIEAAWGLGEAVVSGSVSPDNYVYDRDAGELSEFTVADKKMKMIKDPEKGETVELDVDPARREKRVLSEDTLEELVELGEQVETHYDTPQDVEWATVEGEVYMLQSRPITTIADAESSSSGATATQTDSQSGVATNGDPAVAATDGEGTTLDRESPSDSGADGDGGIETASDPDDEILLDGLGASPGTVSGQVTIATELDQLEQVSDGDIIVTEMTMPDMVPAMKRAVGILTDEGGMTSHAAIVSRELGVPAVVGSGSATQKLSDGQLVTMDGDKGPSVKANRQKPMTRPPATRSKKPAHRRQSSP